MPTWSPALRKLNGASSADVKPVKVGDLIDEALDSCVPCRLYLSPFDMRDRVETLNINRPINIPYPLHSLLALITSRR